MTPYPPIILASQSPRRYELCQQINIDIIAQIPADIDETPHKKELPNHYVQRMADEKAIKVSADHDDRLILGADTIVTKNRRILGKAETSQDAQNMLQLLSGGRHRVITAITLVKNQHILSRRLVTSRVKFKRLSQQEINDYIASNEWRDKAGGYGIQGRASAFVSFISGSYSNIVGLPLYELSQILKNKNI